jgi:ABC-type multidrug transport system ATPase subunit
VAGHFGGIAGVGIGGGGLKNSVSVAEQSPVLRAHRLSFAYRNLQVLTAWSHDFKAGLTWLRGSNGCGKSTLLKLLAGALPADGGELTVRGVNIHQQALAYRREVFWCGPGQVVFDHLSPSEYFGFIRSLYPDVNGQALARHIDGFELRPFVDLPLATLSTGTQRKVWLAIALAASTSVTLLDEPINALDAMSMSHLRATLATCAMDESHAWIVVSHEDLGVDPSLLTVLDMTPAA